MLPWSSPGSAAGGDADSQTGGWGPSPPALVLPPWPPLNRQSQKKKKGGKRKRHEKQVAGGRGQQVSGLGEEEDRGSGTRLARGCQRKSTEVFKMLICSTAASPLRSW